MQKTVQNLVASNIRDETLGHIVMNMECFRVTFKMYVAWFIWQPTCSVSKCRLGICKLHQGCDHCGVAYYTRLLFLLLLLSANPLCIYSGRNYVSDNSGQNHTFWHRPYSGLLRDSGYITYTTVLSYVKITAVS
jgi:hypothetical protein